MDRKKKTVSGRKRLTNQEKRKRIYLYLNEAEITSLKNRAEDSGHRFISEYIRHNIILENYKPRHLEPVQFLKDVKHLAMEVNKVGTNINQIARHLNELKLQHIIPVNAAEAIEEKLGIYLMQQEEIITKLKSVIR